MNTSYLEWVGKPATSNLDNIPGDSGNFMLGHTLPIISDLDGFTKSMFQKHGKIFKVKFLFRNFVWVLGPEATQYVLADPDKIMSSTLGWDDRLGKLFSGGLMLRDFDEHKEHRRYMLGAFNRPALENYLGIMENIIEQELAALDNTSQLLAYPAIKKLTLRIALRVFLGDDVPDRELEKIKEAFIILLAACIAFPQRRIPGLGFDRGIRARQFLNNFIKQLIPIRTRSPGKDLLSQMCKADPASNLSFSENEIVDHMIFLVLAAYDTTVTALTTTLYGLAKNTHWQSILREESASIRTQSLSLANLSAMQNTEWAINEAIRMYPPVVMLFRRTIKSCNILGFDLPPNTSVNLSLGFNHFMPEFWRNPHTFDPDRFSPQRAEHKQHPFLWIPFGGGAHKCLGMHFAYVNAKIVLAHLLHRKKISVPHNYIANYKMLPIPHPVDGLPLTLENVH